LGEGGTPPEPATGCYVQMAQIIPNKIHLKNIDIFFLA
jgi:hypothetical protein